MITMKENKCFLYYLHTTNYTVSYSKYIISSYKENA